MEATRKTLELAASVSNFDIIELWCEDALNSFECKFAYATEQVQKEFDTTVIVGHYPHHSREHRISPQVVNYLFTFIYLLLILLYFLC